MSYATSSQRQVDRSPLLTHILSSSESVSLNLLRLSQQFGTQDGPLFFDSGHLNRTVLFKYPNFRSELANERELHYGAETAWISAAHPIETAIYVPRDFAKPDKGGYGIHVRQPNFHDLLKRHLGVDLRDPSSATDAARLRVIDETPSLDPFLLKGNLADQEVSVPDRFDRLASRDEKMLKEMVSQRIMPVIGQALGIGSSGLHAEANRFVDAIWNPHRGEAKLFIEAFRIDQAQSGEIYRAWKGINYYHIRFERQLSKIAELLQWLGSSRSVPVDMQLHRDRRDHMEALRQGVIARIKACLSKIRQTFRDQDAAYEHFAQQNPAAFREYLVTAGARYWVLAYCYMSVIHAVELFGAAMKLSANDRLMYSPETKMLTSMSALLASKTSLGALVGS